MNHFFVYDSRNQKRWFLICLISGFLLLAADYVTGPFVQFPVTFLIPVMAAAWYIGFETALFLAIALPLGRFSFNFFWEVPWGLFESGINAFIRIFVFSFFAYLISRLAGQSRDLEDQVQTLEGLLPICANCKRIRGDDQTWEPIEKYISDRSEATFTHGLCEECIQKLYPDIMK